MKHLPQLTMLCVYAALAPIFFTQGCSHESDRPDPLQAKNDLLALQDQWAEARVKGDTAFLERLYAPELRLQVMDGSVVKRQDDIALFDRTRGDQNTVRADYIREEGMDVSVYCDTGIVTGVEHVKGTYKGVSGELALRFTDVFVWRDSRWQLVLTQSTEIRTP